ncbi:MAG TPA: cupin domain-containing protein [Solirubrobacteraceae bacterium]|nr:cupin domain-containing protein [Solirubrobacteraceae bacterium]
MEPGVSFAKLDFEAGERFLRLRDALGVSSFGFNQLLLEPGQGSRIHRHERQEEVYVVLEGTLTLEYDGERHELGRGDVARVAPDVRRQLSNRGTERVALLAFGGAEPHAGRDGVAYLAWDDEQGKSPQDVPMPDDLTD